MLRSVKLSLLFILITLFISSVVVAQDADESDPAKAEAVIRQAIKARGGDAYLKAGTLMTRGQYTRFVKGVSGDPVEFVDYIVYPDRERTEFGKGDTKFIQTNVANTGWVYDAKQKMIRDQTDEQVKQFLQGLRYDLDNLLRSGWRQPGAKLVHLGRREPFRGAISEAVRIDFADGASAILHFDRFSHLPLMTEYKSVVETGTVNNETHYFRWVQFGGIQFATLQDSFRDGKQSARVSFDVVNFNAAVPDKLFAKPANIKEVK